MIIPDGSVPSRELSGGLTIARLRLASAEAAFAAAKEESNTAKSRRKEAKEAARRAKKRMRRAKEELREAKRIVCKMKSTESPTVPAAAKLGARAKVLKPIVGARPMLPLKKTSQKRSTPPLKRNSAGRFISAVKPALENSPDEDGVKAVGESPSVAPPQPVNS
jgi:hypothetical protein